MKRDHGRSEASERLDLGLSALVAGAEDEVRLEPPPAQGATKAVSDGAAAPVTATPPAEPVVDRKEIPLLNDAKSRYQVLADSAAWSELIELCETELSAGETEKVTLPLIEARLWWVLAQEKLAALPMQILSAPLDTASSEVMKSVPQADAESHARLKSMAADLLAGVGARLDGEADFAMSVSFLERAATLKSDHRRIFSERVLSKLDALEKHPLRETDRKLRDLRRRLSELVKDYELRAPASGELGKSNALAMNSSVTTGTATPVRVKWTIPVSPIRAAIVAACVVLALLVYRRGSFGSVFLGEGSTLGAVEVTTLSRLPVLALPLIARASDVSNLDALYYDINSRPGSVAVGDSTRESIVPVSSAPREQLKSSNDPVAREPAARVETIKRAVVDTSGPIEGPEFAGIREEASRSHSEPSSIKRADELFGLPNPRNELREGGTKTYTVDEFESEKVYAVIARTKVMVRPSFEASQIADLEPGDKIKVEARTGPWLRLRSKHGQAGYILAQDAELAAER